MTNNLLGTFDPLFAALSAALLLRSLPTSRSFAFNHDHEHQRFQRRRQNQVVLRSSGAQSSSSQTTAEQHRPIRPVFVEEEDPVAFLGATTALFALEVLTERLAIPSREEQRMVGGAVPTAGRQPVFVASSSTDDEGRSFQQQLDSFVKSNSEPILHLSFGPSGIQFSPDILQQIPYVGLHLATPGTMLQDGGGGDTPETARACGTILQQVLQVLSSPSSISSQSPMACVSLDASLHVAMLQANCLPNTKPSLPHNDSYYVMLSNGDSVVIDYLYTERPGGNDPLCCPTHEVLVETSPTLPSPQRSLAQSAAYTALWGNGMDPLWSAAVAASVATLLGDSNFATDEPLTWSDIQSIVQLSRHIRQYGTKEVPGLMRQTYVDYGYK